MTEFPGGKIHPMEYISKIADIYKYFKNYYA